MWREGEEFHHPEEALCYASNGKVEGTHYHGGVLGPSERGDLLHLMVFSLDFFFLFFSVLKM